MCFSLNSRSLRAFKNKMLYPPSAVTGMLHLARKLICKGKKDPVSF